jgi:hypothetical protein
MNDVLFWLLILVGSGLFVYFLPYRNIKIIQNQLAKIIEILEKNK